ncbi:MAG: hypothetical protein ABSA03_04785 [Streptosporangiaceae bacterium]
MAFAPGWLPAGAAYDQAGPRPSWVALSQVALVAVTDACAVASSACHVARSDTASVLVSLAGTGRSNVFIGEDVEAELPEALQKVAADMGNPLADAERALSRIVTRIRVVPLQMGDYLNPAIAAIRRCDPELPRAARGDPDDLGTAAVAAFLAPAVIISKDSVFNRFGLALPADRWTEEAARMLVAAGYDAALEDAAHAAEVGARLLFGVIGAAKNAAVRNPKAATTTAVIAGLAAWYCHRRGWITGEHLRATCAVLRGGCQVHSMSTAGQSKVNRGRPGCDEDRVIAVSQPCVLWAPMDQADVSRCPTGRRDEPPGRRAASPAIGSAAVNGHPGQQGAAIAHGFCSHARAKPAITSDLPGPGGPVTEDG